MITRNSFAGWYRNRFVWVAVILLAVSAGTVVLVNTAGSEAGPPDLRGQITTRLRTTLESADPAQHQHAGHDTQATAGKDGKKPSIICGVRVYGFEPAGVSTLAEVKTVYGFHLCGVAEQQRPWDWAVKLAGPLIVDMSTEPPGIQVVEATEDVWFVDRLKEMFPDKYEELALKEALDDSEMSNLRRRYDEAAGL
ncbi:hypothetical protein GCM10022225_01610 [Plantactinospora mayteni]|uniref:Bypass of forespore C C-terminal domain-containing protein n=1 Tax=Plantactinospora mayteni TaxID=566021 RepID=A0ABQ4EYB3_9ACTN|nr:hypothetical protein [Plantactinospora mayteni]GIG99611.1 hypothetical protein Pma05_61840 [Plantactinospora mayteni]